MPKVGQYSYQPLVRRVVLTMICSFSVKDSMLGSTMYTIRNYYPMGVYWVS